MPIYGQRSKYAEPQLTEEVDTVEKRFSMPTLPKLTIVQMILVAIIVLYAFKARKVKGSVVAALALTVGLLHIYDHMFRVKRGPERLFLLPKKEGYCGGCSK
jgi:hypothetical protein